ncbi:hypothetical protein D3C75_986140 [compost metagenome]
MAVYRLFGIQAMELLLTDGEVLFFGFLDVLIAVRQLANNALRQLFEHRIAGIDLHVFRRDHFRSDGALARFAVEEQLNGRFIVVDDAAQLGLIAETRRQFKGDLAFLQRNVQAWGGFGFFYRRRWGWRYGLCHNRFWRGGGDFRLFAVLVIAGYQPGKQHGQRRAFGKRLQHHVFLSRYAS